MSATFVETLSFCMETKAEILVGRWTDNKFFIGRRMPNKPGYCLALSKNKIWAWGDHAHLFPNLEDAKAFHENYLRFMGRSFNWLKEGF